MAKMNCRCGFVLSTSTSPNNIELRVYTDIEWEKIMDCDTIEPWKIPIPKHAVWRCPECQRIYVFEETSNQILAVYTPEK